MGRLLLFMMATGVEFRGGDLSAAELAALPSTRQSHLLAAIGKKEKSPEIVGRMMYRLPLCCGGGRDIRAL
jgi:hypothetical protein